MPKKKKKNKKKKNEFITKIKGFFNSFKILVVALIIILITLIWFSNHLMSTSRTYMFNGQGNYVLIENGVISLNYDINLLVGSGITYIAEEDHLVNKYKMGYYVNDGQEFIAIAVIEGSNELGFLLSGVVNELSRFNISEPYHNNSFFTRKKIKALDDGLYFIMEATTTENIIINEHINLNFYRVSK